MRPGLRRGFGAPIWRAVLSLEWVPADEEANPAAASASAAEQSRFKKVRVEGHTDNKGTKGHNLVLSKAVQRIGRLVSVLRTRMGVSANDEAEDLRATTRMKTSDRGEIDDATEARQVNEHCDG